MTDDPERLEWQVIRDRVGSASVDDGGLTTSLAEDARHILDERARVLARVRDQELEGSGIEVLLFVVAGERYGLEVSYVRETLRSVGPTFVPGVPEWFVGVENIRSEIVAVVDIARLFGGQQAPAHRDVGLLIVVGQSHAEFAIRCDELLAVNILQKRAIRPLPQSTTSDERRHIVGVTDDAILLLGGDALLADERLFIEQAEET